MPECPVCDDAFDGYAALRDHIRESHPGWSI